MASDEDVAAHRAALVALVELARQYLAAFFSALDTASPEAPKLVTDFYVSLTQEFGATAATLAADYYDNLRAQASVRAGFEAELADPVSSDQAASVSRWASALDDRSADSPAVVSQSEPVVDQPRSRARVRVDDTSVDEPPRTRSRVTVTDAGADAPRSKSRVTVNDASPERLEAAAQRLILKPARETIVRSAGRDPARARWARIPQGVTCAFCLVMASRGAIYLTEQSAGGGPDEDMFKYHNWCDCQPTPFWKGDQYPESYNPDALYAKYMDARSKSGSPNLKRGEHKTSILTKLRELEGIR